MRSARQSSSDKTDGQQRLDNLLSICEAELDKSEVLQGDERRVVLDHVVSLVRDNLAKYPANSFPTGYARLNLHLAQALQGLGETSDNAALLRESEAAFRLAIEGLHRDSTGRSLDAKSGLAAVLQVLGEIPSDADLLRKAVALHRELIVASRGNEQAIEEAGPLENLANCVLALAKIADPEEAERLRSEARDAFTRAMRIYQKHGQLEQERLARSALESIAEEI